MKTSSAYPALAKELETIRQLPTGELAALAGGPALVRSMDIAGESIELEVSVAWHNSAHTLLRITGHARGPSTWHHEHLQETITVAIPTDNSGGD